ncbi:MAG: bile acid:sodium symporter family protein, partial [Thermoguttaceae bacterium]|nr:bile acid:sodium symporter family protein [Thermoguttaceae bacterium]
PLDILAGCVTQFTMMPFLAFALGKLFHLEPGLFAGVVLVGVCPGGTSSNVITFLSGGDVALSVGMTSVNTLLAPFLTPAIAYLLLRTTVNVNFWKMFLSISYVVLIPILAGFVVNQLLKNRTARLVHWLPLVSITAICMIVASVVSHNAEKLMESGPVILVVVVLHNLLGYAGGWVLAKSLRFTPAKTKALAVEIGMQNSGLATVLAQTAFPNLALATIPGALFSVWHNISGAILAGFFKKWSTAVSVSDSKQEPVSDKTKKTTSDANRT